MKRVLILVATLTLAITTYIVLLPGDSPSESEVNGAEGSSQSTEELLAGQYELGRYKTAEKSVSARNDGYMYKTGDALAFVTNELESEIKSEGGRDLQLEFGVEVWVSNWSDDPLRFYLYEAYIQTDNGEYGVTVDYNPNLAVEADSEGEAELWFVIEGETLNDLEEVTLVLPPAKNEYGEEQTLVNTIELEIPLIEDYSEE